MSKTITGYQLTKAFYSELEENEAMQLAYKSTHCSLYTWICELRNRVNMDVVDLPRDYTMKMTGIGSPLTFNHCLEDLAEWGIIEIIFRGKNQWSGPTKVKIAGSFLNKHDTGMIHASNEHDTRIERASYTTKTNKTDKTNKPNKTNSTPPAAESEPGTVPSFDEFWNLYGKKEDRAKCEQKWKGLSPADKKAIMDHLPSYLKAKSDLKFRKNPLTYLNGKCWLDEPEPFQSPPVDGAKNKAAPQPPKPPDHNRPLR